MGIKPCDCNKPASVCEAEHFFYCSQCRTSKPCKEMVEVSGNPNLEFIAEFVCKSCKKWVEDHDYGN